MWDMPALCRTQVLTSGKAVVQHDYGGSRQRILELHQRRCLSYSRVTVGNDLLCSLADDHLRETCSIWLPDQEVWCLNLGRQRKQVRFPCNSEMGKYVRPSDPERSGCFGQCFLTN